MTADTIRCVHAWEALDSRGRPTVGCTVELADGSIGRVVLPSGASTGAHEAVELRDGGERYAGLGVQGAVANVVNVLAPMVLGRRASERATLDLELEAADGTEDLSSLGANAILSVSLATTLANAVSAREPLWRTLESSRQPILPMPMVNILSGGAHAGGAIDVQDLLAIPVGAASFAEAIEWISRVRAACATLLDERGGWSCLVADEGGLAARLASNEAALQLLTDGIEISGLGAESIRIAIDVAASQLLSGRSIVLASEGVEFTSDEWVSRLARWVEAYPIVSIEDPLGEDDWEGWAAAASVLGPIQLLGDDLFVTNSERVRYGNAAGAANAVLIKVNQAGSVRRAEEAVVAANQCAMGVVVSARSGDTEDTWLADLSVAWGGGQIKVGSTMRSERTSKWNRLLELESLGGVEFAGTRGIAPLS